MQRLHERIRQIRDRLSAAHAAEAGERDARIAELKRVAEDAINLAEAAGRDAGRYRWLRDMPSYSAEKAVSPVHGSGVAIYQCESLDAAIDAAIATTEQGHD